MSLTQRAIKLNLYDFMNFCCVSKFKEYIYTTTEAERECFEQHLIVNIKFTQISFSPYLPMILFSNGENRIQLNGVKEVLIEYSKDSYTLTFVCWYGEDNSNKKTYTFKAIKH